MHQPDSLAASQTARHTPALGPFLRAHPPHRHTTPSRAQVKVGQWLHERRKQFKKGTLKPALRADIEAAVGGALVGPLW